MDACANDAEIAAALAAVEEADAATLALAEGGAASAAPAASTGGAIVAGPDNAAAAAADDADSSAAPPGAAAAAAAASESQPAPLPAPPFERPSDEAIVAQENEIRAQIAGSAALVGAREPLSALREEYANEGAGVFAAKAGALAGRYGALRRTRGDGNCFFRSFMFALAEGLLERRDLAERNRVVTRIRQSAKKMTDAGFDAIVFEDALEAWCEQLNRIGIAPGGPVGEPLTLHELEAASGEDSGGLADMGVMLLRLLASAELRSRADHFAPFVLGDDGDDRITDVPSFCARRVEPMGCESDHVHIVALTDALGVAVRVEYLDRSEEEEGEGGGGAGGDGASGGGGGGGGGGGNPNHHDFVPEGAAAPPRVVLLYRPGHYDILYPAVAVS